jgi:hypothetical protein
MFAEPFIRLDAAFRRGANQVNPTAGRLRLYVKRSVSRTSIETEPAVDAAVEFWDIQALSGLRFNARRLF